MCPWWVVPFMRRQNRLTRYPSHPTTAATGLSWMAYGQLGQVITVPLLSDGFASDLHTAPLVSDGHQPAAGVPRLEEQRKGNLLVGSVTATAVIEVHDFT